MDLKRRLMEKYLHSQGAALYDEGCTDEAIALLKQAVALDDRSYTRWHLSLAFKDRNNLPQALYEIDRAITLNPLVARYYYERSRLQKTMGNHHEACLDIQKAVDLDGNYSRIDEIREALGSLDHELSGTTSRLLGDRRINSQSLAEVLAHGTGGSELVVPDFDGLSCTLPCPAFCCYFEGSPVLHGLTIGPWKLLKIRELLRQNGLAEEQFLDRVDLTGEGQILSLIPPHHVLREHGRSCVYSPKKGPPRLHPTLLASLPKGRGYQDLVWIHTESCQCSFLHDRRCMIHGVGDEPALPACKEFFCLTGFVFALLIQWDLIEMETVPAKTMKHLNQVAIEAALIVAKELCRDDDLNSAKKSLEAAVADALKADRQGDHEGIPCLINRIQEQDRRLIKAVTVRKTTIRRKLTCLLDMAPIVEQA